MVRPGPERHNGRTEAHLVPMTVTAQLQRFVEDELQRAVPLADENVELTIAQLRQPRDATLSPADREHFHELVHSLPRNKPAFVQAFAESLRQTVLADLHGTADNPPANTPSRARGLELMDETR